VRTLTGWRDRAKKEGWKKKPEESWVGRMVADGGLARRAGLVVVLAVSALAVLVPPRATAQETAAAQTADHDSKAPPEKDPAARPVEHDPAVLRPHPE
jgi:hypothetical protein